MARMAGEMVHDVLDAFAARDAAKAIHVSESDRQVDDFYNAIFRVLVTFMMENPQSIGQVAHLLFVAKNLERIGDHRSEEHTSELQSLMRISYAVFCLKKKKRKRDLMTTNH